MDQITGGGADDMGTQDAVGFFVGQDLDEAFGLEHGLRPCVAHEAEFADLVGAADFFQLLFRGADAGDLGCGVYHAGNDAIVNVTVLAGHDFGNGHAFVFGLVGQHRARCRLRGVWRYWRMGTGRTAAKLLLGVAGSRTAVPA